MGFRPADDSDLNPRGKKSESSSSKGNIHSASLGEEPVSKSKDKNKRKSVRSKKAKKKAGAMSYVWTFVKVFGTTVGVFVIISGILLGCAMFGLFGGNTVDLEDLQIGANSKVYYINPETGKEVFLTDLTGSDGKREWVDIEDIDKDLQHAFVAIEDERFYKHSGFDILRTGKATVMYLWGKLTGSGSDFGGSTITQQFIKNATGNWENSPTRKIKEISQAVNLEKQLSKDEILEMYLNIINLSNNCYGVQAASKEFFGKPASNLTPAESACIAGITQNPTKYDPIRNPKDNKAKQEIVLKKMLELEYISQKEYDKAVKEELKFVKTPEDSSDTGINDYYIEQIVECITQEFMDMGYSRELAFYKTTMGGLKIVTTIDKDVQEAIDSVYSDPAACADLFGYNPDSKDNPQSAIVILAPDGGIKGIYGGLGPKMGNLILDRSDIPRQPGSSIKPISAYAPAIDEGIIHASTVYEDGPMAFDKSWSPKNSYSDTSDKTVQLAVQKSSNRIAAQVVRDLGVNKSYNHLRDKLGISSLTGDDKNLPALSLGGMFKGISPLEMAGAYTPFINQGVYTKPHIYTKVYDKTGKVILRNTPKTHQAISPQTAYIMTTLLRRVVTSGTGTLAGLPSGVFAAGKTGTSDNTKDKWFVGFTPNYVCGIWHGYDDNRNVTSKVDGCQRAFSRVMEEVHKKVEAKAISVPKKIVMLSVCEQTGKIATGSCPTAISLPFTADNKPTKKCYHKIEELFDDDGNEIVDLDAEAEETEETTEE